jgi:NAD(P)-dependent dehydrogenase (short-subunit alcohol dehydrogenase family)
MTGRLARRGAIVTGAARGIGRAIVERLLSEGAQVAALDLAISAQDVPAGALALPCDVTDTASLAQAVAASREAFGRLDIAVANAGIGMAEGDGSDQFYASMADRNAELAEHGQSDIFVDQLIHMEDHGWAKVMDVNIGGTFRLARELAPRKIRVNAVAPGPTNTPIMQGIPQEWIASMEANIPLGRMAEPSEIASAVAYLASDDASLVNGSVLVANGASYYF